MLVIMLFKTLNIDAKTAFRIYSNSLKLDPGLSPRSFSLNRIFIKKKRGYIL